MAKDTGREENKEKALELAITAIEKSFGKGSIFIGNTGIPGTQFIPSGSLALNKALGGGWCRGRIIEILGIESGGKTTLALTAIAEAQKIGLRAAFIDAEHALDLSYARNIGVNTEDLVISQPGCGEEALDIAEQLIRSGAINLVIIDSIAALVPKVELEGNMSDQQMGAQARLMGKAMRKLDGIVYTTNTTLIFINQIRNKIGVMFGSNETSCGGNALKYYASQRVDIRRIGSVKDSDEIIANETRAKVIKNKVAPPYREAEFQIRFGEGIDQTGELIDIGSELGLVEKAGSWFSYNGERIGQGKENVRTFLKENNELRLHLQEQIKERYYGTKAG